MNIPNLLSLVRVALVPCFAIVFLSSLPNAALWAGGIFIIATLTDLMDGYLARKWNQITKLGRILDPLADKLLQVTAVACLAVQKVIPSLFFIVFAAKELFMLLGGVFLVKRTDDVMPSNMFGKMVSFLISTLIVVTIFFKEFIHPNTTNLLYTIAVTLALAAMVVYVAKYLKNHSSVGRKKPVSAQEADE
jgi:cardiolipin synthase